MCFSFIFIKDWLFLVFYCKSSLKNNSFEKFLLKSSVRMSSKDVFNNVLHNDEDVVT